MRLQSIFTLIAVSSVMLLAITLTQGQTTTENAEPSLNELLKQRRDIFAQFVQRVEARYARELATLEEVLNAKGQLLDAELELATSREQRLNVLKERVEIMRSFEKQARANVKQGRQTADLLWHATAARLDAQIALVREKKN